MFIKLLGEEECSGWYWMVDIFFRLYVVISKNYLSCGIN